jgi:hypothetical protein
MKKNRISQPDTVADFKHRIAIIMRERETGIKYSIIGGPRADDCVVRKPHCSGCRNPAQRTAENQGYSACCNKRIS